MPALPLRERPWASAAFGSSARVAALQLGLGVVLLPQTEPGSGARTALVGGILATSVLLLPLARFAAQLSRRQSSAYWWAGRAWAMATPAAFAKTMTGAYDGSGPLLAERVATPFLFAFVLGLSFCIGAQGALLAVPKDVAVNVEGVLIAMAVVKLQVAYTHAYALLQVAVLGGIAIGYACVSKYADLREAEREAAEVVVLGAAAVNQPYVVTDSQLAILAVNQRFCEVLGYDINEVYGKHVSTILESEVDAFWVTAVLSKGEKEHVWSVVTKAGPTLPVRITLGEQRCPISGTQFYWAKFSSMALEYRNMQLAAEKERLAWDLVTLQCYECTDEDPREHLKVRVAEGTHRTLGAMQDQRTTDDAVSNAQSFDHVASNASPTLPPRDTSPPPSIVSLESSVMDTVSQAAAKDCTRAPPPPKSRLPRPKKTISEPLSIRPKADNSPGRSKRAIPRIERVADMFEGA
jgi:PAS domain S-box-containing protein